MNIQLHQKQKGFTLLELVIVIVLLGVMALGISSFFGLATQTYVNASSRDELISTARFAVERLNRELRQALPNSVRIKTNTAKTAECLEFLPVIATSTYIDLPLKDEPASDIVTAIKFLDNNGNDYVPSAGGLDSISVYGTKLSDIYTSRSQGIGQLFSISQVVNKTSDVWTIRLTKKVNFISSSPTQRLFIVGGPVSYCQEAGELYRTGGYTLSAASYVFPPGTPIPMANKLSVFNGSNSAFSITLPSLRKNAIVQVKFRFEQHDEIIEFNNEVQMVNSP